MYFTTIHSLLTSFITTNISISLVFVSHLPTANNRIFRPITECKLGSSNNGCGEMFLSLKMGLEH